jgi:hypothetical protein
MSALYVPNHSIQRTGASRSAQSVIIAQWRLASAADAGRYALGSHLVFIAGHFLHLLSSMIRYSMLGIPFGSGKMAGHMRSTFQVWRWHNKRVEPTAGSLVFECSSCMVTSLVFAAVAHPQR